MSSSTIEKELCEKCGVEARENTQFCYNCGTPIVDLERGRDAGESDLDSSGDAETEDNLSEPSNGAVSHANAKTALDQLSDRLKADEPRDDEKFAQAADKRRKARVVRRQPKQYTWEPVEDLTAARVIIFSVLIAIATAVVVLITIFWK